MKIIADTNIWYYLGQDQTLYESVSKLPISPTFVNIYELSKTDNLIDKEVITRQALLKLFDFKTNVIFEPPFIYIAKMKNDFYFDPFKEIGDLLNFTQKFAKGHNIDKVKEFRKYIIKKRTDLQTAADFFNAEAERIRQQITDKKEHKKEDSIIVTSGFINFCVQTATKMKRNIEGLDLDKIELLITTLDHYFRTIETSKMKIQANDWYDFAILSYVQPGDKYWTREKRWKRLIIESGNEKYLFEK